MGKKTVFFLIGVVIIFFSVNRSNAAVLGTIEYDRTGSIPGEFADVVFSICYPLPNDLDSMSLSWDVTGNDIGKTFLASAKTHQNFDPFVAALTNGIDNGLFLSDNHSMLSFDAVSGFPIPVEYESTLISGIRNGVDFEGYAIESIALTLNNLELNKTFHNMGQNGYYTTNYTYDVTYTVMGTPTPEPITLLLFSFGFLALNGRHSSYRSQSG